MFQQHETPSPMNVFRKKKDPKLPFVFFFLVIENFSFRFPFVISRKFSLVTATMITRSQQQEIDQRIEKETLLLPSNNNSYKRTEHELIFGFLPRNDISNIILLVVLCNQFQDYMKKPGQAKD